MSNFKTEEERIRVIAEDGERFTLVKTTEFNWTPAGGGAWIEGVFAVVTTDGNAALPNPGGGWRIFNSRITNNNPNFVIAHERTTASKNDPV